MSAPIQSNRDGGVRCCALVGDTDKSRAPDADSAGSGRGGRSLDTVRVAECIEFMATLPDACVDAVLTDLPYGTTQNAWDTVIDLPAWWTQVRRVCLGAVVTTASQPFTSQMVMSNVREFRHEWIWRKNRGSNFANTVREPFKEHESVVVFAAGKWTYNQQREARRGSGGERAEYKVAWNPGGSNYREFKPRGPVELTADRVPSSVQEFTTETGLHPTQKPVELMRYLVRTYTNPGDVVLDMCCGSGTTLVAAKQEGRHFIGCDSEEKYVTMARKRLESELPWAAGVRSGGENSESKSGACSPTKHICD